MIPQVLLSEFFRDLLRLTDEARAAKQESVTHYPARGGVVSQALLSLIRKFEGLRLKAYLCPAGVATIGYGHTGKDVSLSMAPISEAVAEDLMQEDALAFVIAASNQSPVLWFDENKQAAISDFCFNLGTTRYKASTLKRRVDAGDWEGAQAELAKWVWGGGRKLPGLILRRQVEATLLKET